MQASHCFFSNTACRYFPCHTGVAVENFNCLFCYCPLYMLPDCGGEPQYIQHADCLPIKDCSACTRPHRPEAYADIVKRLREQAHGTSACPPHVAGARL